MNPNGRQSGIEDLNITKQELDNIGEALKNEQFRKLLCDYVDEINDPENRALYEREIEQYERERGTAVQFVRPVPGYVIKTSADGVRKVFVNICTCDVLQKPTSRRVSGGDHWSLPNCLSPAREDYDKARKPCDVFDVIFHPDVLELAKRGVNLKNMVEDTALSMIEKNNDVVLDKTNLKYPKISYKGFARPLAIRNQIKDFQRSAEPDSTDIPQFPYNPPVDRPIQHHDLGTLKQKSLFTVPKYVIKQRTDIDIQEHGYNMNCKLNAAIPKELIVEINLPLLDSSANVELDVLPKSLKLICHKPSKYKLEINLPYNVLEEDGSAKFDQSTKKLIVTLPVLRNIPSLVHTTNTFVTEIETAIDEICINGHDINTVNNDVETIVNNSKNNINGHEGETMNGNQILVTNEQLCDRVVDTECNSSNGNVVENEVHYSLPDHKFIYGNKCILRFDVNNVDPTSINIIVISDKNLISGKFHSMGSGYFPIWFSFCIQIPSKSSLFKSDVKVLPTDINVILEFFLNFNPNCIQYLYGLNENNLTIQGIETETQKENSKSLANSVSTVSNDSDDDGDVLEDKEEIELKDHRVQDTKTNDDPCQCKDKNDKTTKEKRKKKKRNIKKSNAIPIVGANDISQSGKKVDFIPGSLPIELNMRPIVRGILKKRSQSECSTIEDKDNVSPRMYSSSVDNVDTESSDVFDSSYDIHNKKTVRFNDHVIEKKINFNISIAAQAKKHRQRQQRKRNMREYGTPSESEVSEAEDKPYGPLNMVSESEETSVSESSAGEMSDDNDNGSNMKSVTTVMPNSKKDHKRRKSKSARKNASLAKQTSINNLMFPIEY